MEGYPDVVEKRRADHIVEKRSHDCQRWRQKHLPVDVAGQLHAESAAMITSAATPRGSHLADFPSHLSFGGVGVVGVMHVEGASDFLARFGELCSSEQIKTKRVV